MESAGPRLDLSLEAEDKDQPGMLGPQEKPLWGGSGNFSEPRSAMSSGAGRESRREGSRGAFLSPLP